MISIRIAARPFRFGYYILKNDTKVQNEKEHEVEKINEKMHPGTKFEKFVTK